VQKYSFLSVFLKLNSKIGKMIFITGATGLVGGNLLWYLLQTNERITAIRRPTSNLNHLKTIFSFYTNNPNSFLSRIDWKNGDVLDFESINNAMSGISIVYHCAAVVSLGKVNNNIMEINVEGTKNIVRAALENNVTKLCFVSSIAACGKSSTGTLIDENAVWTHSTDISAYSRSKYLSEQEVWKGIDKGLNAVIVNPGVVLGVSGSNTGSSQLFSQVKKGLMFYTNGGSGYVDVQDVVKCMIQLTNSAISGERFILVSENCSNKQVMSWMADGFGKQRPFIPIGKKLIFSIGFLSEIFGKIFKFEALIDRGTARSVSKQEFYSSKKVENLIDFEFKPIAKCIQEVCEFEMKL
jgi:nucleoside-diphosphate-sugar epimerase